MRPGRTRLELRMELTTDVPGMSLQLDHLHEGSVRREAAQIQAVLDELLAVLVVDLVAVAVSLTYLRCPINRCRLGARANPTRVRAEAHRAKIGRASCR